MHMYASFNLVKLWIKLSIVKIYYAYGMCPYNVDDMVVVWL